MIKTVLVPVGGSDADQPVLEAALMVARCMPAHLEFLHIHIGPGEAALHTPHVDFASGAALRSALRDLDEMSKGRAARAERYIRDFCARANIALVEKPGASRTVTARWRREEGDALQRLLFHARHNDLMVMVRPAQADGLPADRLETLLLQGGRPLLIVPSQKAMSTLRTAMVCWKETPDAARALSSAMPLLMALPRVIVLAVREGKSPEPGAVDDLVNQLGWHGINAECMVLARNGKSTAEVLFSTAKSQGVDLMVMGGYGHAHVRETLFGGCTQAVMQAAETAVFLMH